jgi:hypothetical protein
MNEFKIQCPACGQDILCDRTFVGTRLACPSCNATITVPEETEGATAVPIPAGDPPTLPGCLATTAQRTSRLAIASLVCSLLSFVTCIGWLPGIICGHMARSRIRRNPALKGNGLATAGLVIGYVILVLGAGTAGVRVWSVSKAVKHGFENVRHDLATTNFIIKQTQPAAVSSDNQPVEPVEPEAVVTNSQPAEPVNPEPVVINHPPMEAGKSGWTADISKISFPYHRVSGKLHGSDFTFRTASFRNGDFKITSENGLVLDIYRLDESVESQHYEIHSFDSANTNPRVRMTWNEGDVIQSSTYIKGYDLKLQMDQATNRTMSGRIYLCFPDASKSYVAGTFKVRLPTQK